MPIFNHLILTARSIKSSNCIARSISTPVGGPWAYTVIPDMLLHSAPPEHTELCGMQRLDSQQRQADLVAAITDGLDPGKDVLVFIHGYHPGERSLFLNLVYFLHQTYVIAADNPITKILFVSWPNFGPMAIKDDQANFVGEELKQRYLSLLKDASDKLKQRGSRMHLMAQSFGNQVLNGFISAVTAQEMPGLGGLFKNVFLTASDVPYLGVQVGGVVAKSGNTQREYRLDRLSGVAERVVVFHDPNDAILNLSRIVIFQGYERLGHMGLSDTSLSYPPNFVGPPLSSYEAGMVPIPPGTPQHEKNLRHQYFHTNPDVVRIVKRYAGAAIGAPGIA